MRVECFVLPTGFHLTSLELPPRNFCYKCTIHNEAYILDFYTFKLREENVGGMLAYLSANCTNPSVIPGAADDFTDDA